MFDEIPFNFISLAKYINLFILMFALQRQTSMSALQSSDKLKCLLDASPSLVYNLFLHSALSANHQSPIQLQILQSDRYNNIIPKRFQKIKRILKYQYLFVIPLLSSFISHQFDYKSIRIIRQFSIDSMEKHKNKQPNKPSTETANQTNLSNALIAISVKLKFHGVSMKCIFYSKFITFFFFFQIYARMQCSRIYFRVRALFFCPFVHFHFSVMNSHIILVGCVSSFKYLFCCF